jgi:hypothetical protein
MSDQLRDIIRLYKSAKFMAYMGHNRFYKSAELLVYGTKKSMSYEIQ